MLRSAYPNFVGGPSCSAQDDPIRVVWCDSIWRDLSRGSTYALAAQEVFGFLDEDVAADVGDGVGEGNLLGAGLDAVLRKSALLDTAISGKGAKALFREDFAGGVIVEEFDLGDGGGADEAGVLVELRADFHAAGAGDAVGERVIGFLLLGEDTWAGAEIVGAIDGDPCFDAHEVLKEYGAVDLEIADERELRQRRDLDGLFQILNQRRAGHAGLAVDEHGAGATNFFEAIGVVGDGSGVATLGGDGVCGDFHHGGDDVHAGTPLQLEVFPCRWRFRAGLALDFEFNGFGCHVPSMAGSTVGLVRVVQLQEQILRCAYPTSWSPKLLRSG
jgi:hypothetical protein